MNVKDEMRGKYEEVMVKYLIQIPPHPLSCTGWEKNVLIIPRQDIQSSDGKSTFV